MYDNSSDDEDDDRWNKFSSPDRSSSFDPFAAAAFYISSDPSRTTGPVDREFHNDADVDGSSSPLKRRRFDRTRSFESSIPEHPANLVFHEPPSPSTQIQAPLPPGCTRLSLPSLRDPIINAEINDILAAASVLSDHTDPVALSTAGTLTSMRLGGPQWPLEDKTEARLFRYYVDHVGRFFDMCDPERHFTLIVPCRAIICPPLMNAIFAISARHMSQTSYFDKNLSDQYYQTCLSTLVPMLGDSSSLMDENLFAATVILRHLEEVDGQ